MSLGFWRVFGCTTMTLSLDLKMCFVIWALSTVANWWSDNWSGLSFCSLNNERDGGREVILSASGQKWWLEWTFKCSDEKELSISLCKHNLVEDAYSFLMIFLDVTNTWNSIYTCWCLSAYKHTHVNVYQGSDMHCENNVTLWKDNLVGCLAIK